MSYERHKRVALEDLEGIRLLDGVEWGTHPYDGEICWCMKFRLDDVTYVSLEDPSDGYRSSLRWLVIDETPPRYTFPPSLVMVRVRRADERGTDEYVLEMRDFFTGQVVLETGTHNIDDYYPCYVARWNLDGLIINRALPPELKRKVVLLGDAASRILNDKEV